jgi:hypothetical protein
MGIFLECFTAKITKRKILLSFAPFILLPPSLLPYMLLLEVFCLAITLLISQHWLVGSLLSLKGTGHYLSADIRVFLLLRKRTNISPSVYCFFIHSWSLEVAFLRTI